MRPNSLRLLQQAARINPHVKVSELAADDTYGEALVDVHAGMHEGKTFSVEAWDAVLEEIDNDPRTLAEYMDAPAVRAMIRAQEASNAAS